MIDTSEWLLNEGDALLLVDVQKDFLPGGRLAVPKGNQVIPVLNGYIDRFMRHQLPIFASRDWHPANHCSFRRQGGPWPEHCVAGSAGAEFADGLQLPPNLHILSKGTEADKDGYSAFADTDFGESLERLSVRRLFVGGLATEYCVLNTVADALNRHYRVLLLTDAVRAVDVHRHDGERAIDTMIKKGAMPITLAMIR